MPRTEMKKYCCIRWISFKEREMETNRNNGQIKENAKKEKNTGYERKD